MRAPLPCPEAGSSRALESSFSIASARCASMGSIAFRGACWTVDSKFARGATSATGVTSRLISPREVSKRGLVCRRVTARNRETPPHKGFGSRERGAGGCVVPAPAKKPNETPAYLSPTSPDLKQQVLAAQGVASSAPLPIGRPRLALLNPLLE